VSRANDRVARTGKTFEVAEKLGSFADYGWRTLQDTFAILRDRLKVSGIVAYIGADARMDAALALLNEVPVVNFAPSEPAIHESENPWIFRCGANDPRHQQRLLDHALGPLARSRPVVLTTRGDKTPEPSDRWGGLPSVEYDPAADALFEELRRLQADVLLTWADAPTTATLLRKLRAEGLDQLVVGSPRIVNPEFVTLAGPDAGAVIALARCSHFDVAGDLPRLDEETLRRRPPTARERAAPRADRSFEAATHLLVAIELAGPDREAVRRTLRAMGEPMLANLEDGVWSLSDLESP